MGNSAVKGIFGGKDSLDSITVNKNNPIYLRVKKKRDEMTGWERIEFIFKTDEFGDISPEMHRIKDASLLAFFIGGIMGGVGRSRIAYSDFFRQNTATQFETPLQAKKMLQDQVTLGMGSGIWRIGWRMAAFTFIYMSGSTMIAAYRNKCGVVDQVGGAGMAGFLYKFRDGPKAAFSGTVFGSLLGLVAGSITLACVKLFDMDIESANMEYYSRLSKQLDQDKERMRRAREASDETPSLERMHELFVASMNQQAKEKHEQKLKDSEEQIDSDKAISKAQQIVTDKVESRMRAIEESRTVKG